MQLEDDLGGRDVLVETLHFANLDPRGVELVRLAGTLKDVPLVTLCRQCNLSPYEVIRLHKDGALNRGQTIAYARATEAMNAIMDDLIKKSVDHTYECSRCTGTGKLSNKAVCPSCNGGQVFVAADPKAQTKILDILKLGKKEGAANIVMNKFGSDGGGFFDQFVAASDKAMRGLDKDSPVIDGTVAEGDANAQGD